MKSPDEIKKRLGEALAEARWVVDDGDMHDLRDACDTACKIMADALALIQQFESSVPRWISVEERMPKRYEHVLVATRFTDEGEQDVEVAYLAIDRWRKPDGPLYGKVTHWMPLPEPPKAEST